MISPAPSVRLLESRVAEIRRHQKEPRAIGFHLASAWSGPSSLQVDGEELPVAFCPSPLAFRARLAEAESSPVPPVLLTDRDQDELGEDVLARLFKGRLFRLNPWEALYDRFGVRGSEGIDRRLLKHKWLPDHLLALPEDQVIKPASGFLDLDEVWQLLLTRLGLAGPRPDLRELLEWTTLPESLASVSRLPADAREAHTARLAESAGLAGNAVLHLVSAGRGNEAVAAGLVCEVLFPANGAADPDQQRALGRFEAALLEHSTLAPEAGRAWAEAAAGLVHRRLETEGEPGIAMWLGQARKLLIELNVETLGERSSWLPAGFDRAFGRYAAALASWPERQDVARLPDLGEACRAVRDHGLAPLRQAEVSAAGDMLRLSRWLAGRKSAALAGSFPEAAADYGKEGSWVDLARTRLVDAPLPLEPGTARDRLLQAVLERRETENRRFAELLAKWSESGTAAAPLVPVESMLDLAVAPLAQAGPVLLLVLDGMSFAVFRELARDLAERGWEEQRPAQAPFGLLGIGLLPTVTQVCRASLLRGELRTGNASAESQGFAAHPGLRQRSSANLPPLLFHKSDLSGEGAGLSRQVRDEVARPDRRIVGVVLNVVDDQLPKGHQLVRRWTVSSVRYLGELLQAAADAGRAVILTADHGHVIERDTELRRAEGAGARYRPAGAPPEEGEILVRGPRVLLGEGSGLVLAWSEGHRYTALQSGYHGGASPQEVLVPLSVWTASGETPPGWKPAADDSPAWWRDEEPAPIPEPAPVRAPRLPAKPAKRVQPTLFEGPAEPSGPEPWLDELFSSPVYGEQRERSGRQALADQEVGSVLAALAARGGQMTLPALARQRGLPVTRVQGLVAALQRLLNVEGYPVLSLDPASGTVTLNRELLEAQFPRGEAEA
jgi:hypothetical protein